MKTKTVLTLVLLSFAVLFLAPGCQKEPGPAPQLPPASSMIMDLDFGGHQQAGIVGEKTLEVSFFAIAFTNVQFWATVATLHSAIPATAFEMALQKTPVWNDDLKVWIWSYDVPFDGVTYEAELKGKIVNDSLKWEMYLSVKNATVLQDLLWFSGKSHYGRTGGWWVLNSPIVEGPLDVSMQPALKVTWSYTNETVNSLKYTYVAELVPVQEGVTEYIPNNAKGSFIEFGRVNDTKFDAYFTIHSTERNEGYSILWNTSTNAGKITKAGTSFQGCWNSHLVNAPCE